MLKNKSLTNKSHLTFIPEPDNKCLLEADQSVKTQYIKTRYSLNIFSKEPGLLWRIISLYSSVIWVNLSLFSPAYLQLCSIFPGLLIIWKVEFLWLNIKISRDLCSCRWEAVTPESDTHQLLCLWWGLPGTVSKNKTFLNLNSTWSPLSRLLTS